jgi:hypothetical protein
MGQAGLSNSACLERTGGYFSPGFKRIKKWIREGTTIQPII